MLASFILANLVGPLNTPNWESACCSLTAELAKALKKQIEQTANASSLAGQVDVRNGSGPGFSKGANGALVRFIVAGWVGAHSLGCDVAIIDDLGLFEERDRDLHETMITSLGTTNDKLIAIKVRGFSTMFSEMAARKVERSVFWLEFKADDDADLLDEEQWRKANPSLGTIKSLDDMRVQAKGGGGCDAVGPGQLQDAAFEPAGRRKLRDDLFGSRLPQAARRHIAAA